MKDRNKVLFGFVMLLMVVGIIGFSYALFTTKVEKKGALNIVAGTLSCPIESKELTNNQITLKASEEREIEITLINQSLVDIHSIITYTGNNVEVLAASSNESAVEVENLSNGETKTYIFKLKNNSTDPETITFYGRCGLSNKELNITGENKITDTYERIEPNAPKLVEGLIPVVYDESQSSWVKANTTKQWYNYYNQEWANAVTVVEKTTAKENGYDREYYQTAEAGTPILMDDINTMWVWIPRYEYNFVSIANYAGGTAENPGAIGINFVSGTSNKVSDSDNYKMHPAFTFGEEELTGIWYGKFETSSKESCTVQNYSVGNDCDIETYTPEIKPNVTSWRGIRVSTAFTVSRKMEKEYSNEYGFTDENMDTHMSKNSEWGAVAYLSQSAYGKYGNDQSEVAINSCGSYMTGVAGCSEDYTSANGLKASTTGNITGVYDMRGGAYEYVMGALSDGKDPTKPRIGYDTSRSSGFNGVLNSGELVSNGRSLPDSKYYDLYTSSNSSSNTGSLSATACNGGVCYGHALSETAGWYGDYQYFVNYSGPWSNRGGSYNEGATVGMFAFSHHNGGAGSAGSFRLVLAPIEE